MKLEMQETIIKVLKLPHYVENEANLKYSTPAAACFDICAAVTEPVVLKAGERFAVPTGVKFIPEYPIWCRINSRSGLALKAGVIAIGGIIDTDYRGEIKVILLNTNNQEGTDYIINPGERIAQVEVPFPYRAVFEEITPEAFAQFETTRGEGGFGSTGK